MKPMLASDWDEKKIVLPAIMQPKIDGVRGLNLEGKLTGRSLKSHANKFVTEFFSHPALIGMDGEMAAESETHPALCRLTSSALGTIKGEPWIMWHLFDYITPETVSLPYEARYERLCRQWLHIATIAPWLGEHLKLVPSFPMTTVEQVNAQDAAFLDMGYEGSILRKPDGLYKHGRSTVKEAGLLRIKRFVEREFRIDEIEEGQLNTNVATINELGNTTRSSHQSNMVPNGMVGAFKGTDLETGQYITVAAGTLPHALRKEYWENPDLVLRKIGKYKMFPKGIKDKPRFPTFQSIRVDSDMV